MFDFKLAAQLALLIKRVKVDTTALFAHANSTLNPHSTTKVQVGLGNVDNTSDAAKPISSTQQAALDSKAPLSHVGAAGTSQHPAATDALAGFMSAGDKAKLDGLASGATANSSDATLLARVNHTGTQLASTISDFAATVRGTLLTGIDSVTNAAVSATDTVLTAIGKLYANITAHKADSANPHSVTKNQVGLSNVDNTSDADKPVSSAQQVALDLKAPLSSPVFTDAATLPGGSVFKRINADNGGRILLEAPTTGTMLAGNVLIDLFGNALRVFESGGTNRGIYIDLGEAVACASSKVYHQGFKPSKADVGLANVENTSDANKPVSTTQQTALDAKAALLDPFFTGDYTIINAGPLTTNIAALPNTSTGYESRARGSGATLGAAVLTFHRPGAFAAFFGVDTDNKLKFGGWSLGGVAYAIYHEGHKPAKGDVGLSNVDNTSDANKPVSTAQQTALNLKADLNNPTFTGQVATTRSRTTRAFNTAQFQAYTEPNSTIDFSSIALHIQDASSAPQLGYDSATGKVGQFDSIGEPIFTWDVGTVITGVLKAATGHVTQAVANTDYLPVNNAVHTGTTSLGAFTVANLPASPAAYSLAFATNGRKTGEAAAGGTGVPVYFGLGAWRVFSTDAQVLA